MALDGVLQGGLIVIALGMLAGASLPVIGWIVVANLLVVATSTAVLFGGGGLAEVVFAICVSAVALNAGLVTGAAGRYFLGRTAPAS